MTGSSFMYRVITTGMGTGPCRRRRRRKKNSSCGLQDAFHDTMVHGTSKAQVKSVHLEEQQYKKRKEPSGPRCAEDRRPCENRATSPSCGQIARLLGAQRNGQHLGSRVRLSSSAENDAAHVLSKLRRSSYLSIHLSIYLSILHPSISAVRERASTHNQLPPRGEGQEVHQVAPDTATKQRMRSGEYFPTLNQYTKDHN